MRNLLLLLILIFVHTHAFSWSLPDIAKMKVNCGKYEVDCITTLPFLMDRVAVDCEYSIADYINESDIRSDYERMTMASCPKPDFADLTADLILYKAEETVKENDRLAEVARIDDWTNRVNALPDLRLAMFKCLYMDSNAKQFAKIMIRFADQAKLDCLESKSAEIQAEFDAEIAKKDTRKNDIQQIKAAFAQIDASSKPAWEKKILKRLVNELKE